MSTVACSAVWRHSQATGAARLVLLAMADEADSTGALTAYRRSQSWLADKAKCDPRTVRRAVDALVELGEVEVLAHGTGRDKADYQLHLPDLDAAEGGRDARPRSGQHARAGRAVRPPRVGKPPAPSPRSCPVTTTPTASSTRGVAQGVPMALALEQPPMPSGPALGSDRDVWFARFWQAYPRRAGKGAARKAWASVRREGVDPAVLVAGAERYAADPNREAEYTRHPATWLNGEGWLDDPLPARAMPRTRTEQVVHGLVGGPVAAIDYGGVFTGGQLGQYQGTQQLGQLRA